MHCRRAMTADDIVPRVQQIDRLVRDGQLDLALHLTRGLEEDLDVAVASDTGVTEPVLELIRASRIFTETMIDLRAQRPQ
jgi:hypothetical protein